MTLHRFFVRPELISGSRVSFPPEAAHQIRRVLRLERGDEVVVLDGTGLEFVVRLDTADGELTGTVEETRQNRAELPVRLVLYQALIKPPKLEMVLQKCTELGVASIVPVETARSLAGEPSDSRMRRYEAIIREAAEQCRRGLIPSLEPPVQFRTALERASQEGPAFFLWEGDATLSLLAAPVSDGGGTVNLFVGPEGGFTPEEAQEAERAGACPVTLGPRILRAETAAIAGTALLATRLMER